MENGQINEEILKKYNCEMKDLKRIYHVPLNLEEYNLTFTSPLELKIGDFYSTVNSWQKLIVEVATHFSDKYDLCKFKPKWVEKYLFTSNKNLSDRNMVIKEGLYFNYHAVANNLYKFFRDLIIFIKTPLEDCYMDIFIYPVAEPKELRKEIISFVKECLSIYLRNIKHFDEEEITKTRVYIKLINNKIPLFTNTTYNNLYLVSDKETLFNLIYKIREGLNKNFSSKKETVDTVNYYLDLYYEFFKYLSDTIKLINKWTVS